MSLTLQAHYVAVLIEIFPKGRRAKESSLICNCNEEQKRFYSRVFRGKPVGREAGGFDLRRWLLRMDSPDEATRSKARGSLKELQDILKDRKNSCIHMDMLRDAQNPENDFSRTDLGKALADTTAEPSFVLSKVQRQNSLHPLSPNAHGDIMETMYVSSDGYTLAPGRGSEASDAEYNDHAEKCTMCKHPAVAPASATSNSATAAATPSSNSASSGVESGIPALYEAYYKTLRLMRGHNSSEVCVRQLRERIFSVSHLKEDTTSADPSKRTSSVSTFDGDSCILVLHGDTPTCIGRQDARCSCHGGACEDAVAAYLRLTRPVKESKLWILPNWYALSPSLRLHTNFHTPPIDEVFVKEPIDCSQVCTCEICLLLPASGKKRLLRVLPRLASMAACQSGTYYDGHQADSHEISKDDKKRFLNNCACFGDGCESRKFLKTTLPSSSSAPPPPPSGASSAVASSAASGVCSSSGTPPSSSSSSSTASATAASSAAPGSIPRVCSTYSQPTAPSSFAPATTPVDFLRSQVLSPQYFSSGIRRCLCKHEPHSNSLERYNLPHNRGFYISAGGISCMQVEYFYCPSCTGFIFLDGREHGIFFLHTLTPDKKLDCVYAFDEALLNLFALSSANFHREAHRMRLLLQGAQKNFPFLAAGNARAFFLTAYTLWIASAVLPPVCECPICRGSANCTLDGVLAGPRQEEVLKQRERSGQLPAGEASPMHDMECDFLGGCGFIRKNFKSLLAAPAGGNKRGGIISDDSKDVYFEKTFSPEKVEQGIQKNLPKKHLQSSLMIQRAMSLVQALKAVCETHSETGYHAAITKFIPPHYIPFFESIVFPGYSSSVFPFPVEVHRGLREFLREYDTLAAGDAPGTLCDMDKANCDRIRAAVFDKKDGQHASLLQSSFKYLPLFVTAFEEEDRICLGNSIVLIKKLNNFYPLLSSFAEMTCHFILSKNLQRALRVNITKRGDGELLPCDPDALNFQEVTGTYARSLGIVGNRHILHQNREALPKLQRVPRNKCNSKKVFTSHRNLGSGFVTCVCSHGFIQGFFAMDRKESSSLIADIVWNCFPHLGHLCYDDMCHLWPNAIERDRRSLMLRCFAAVDASHWKTHLCAAHKNVKTFVHIPEVRLPVGDNYQTQSCEQLHKRLGEDTGLRKLIAFLGWDKGLLYLHLYASARNAELLYEMNKLKKKLSPADSITSDSPAFLSRRKLRMSSALLLQEDRVPCSASPDASLASSASLDETLASSASLDASTLSSASGRKKNRAEAFSNFAVSLARLPSSPSRASSNASDVEMLADASDRYYEWRRPASSSAPSPAAQGWSVKHALAFPQLRKFCKSLQDKGPLKRHAVDGDGNCLYRAASYYLYGTDAHHAIVRDFAVRYIKLFEREFRPLADTTDFNEYLETMRTPGTMLGKWGGELEITALSHAYEMDEHALVLGYLTGPTTADGIVVSVTIQRDVPDDVVRAFRFSHENTNHYNALLPAQWKAMLDAAKPGTYENMRLSELEKEKKRVDAAKAKEPPDVDLT